MANAFICTANIDAVDGGARIVDGNRKVLAARLSDAKFFYDTDLKVPLEEQAKKLDRIVFHEKLGTVADKVDRVAKLARWLVEEGIVTSPSPLRGEGRGEGPPSSASRVAAPLPTLSPEGEREKLAALAERAARLCKADLVTGMVGEFPELQGLMGGYYAAAQGEDPAVAAAIRDHYKPVGQGDEVPTDPVTVAVSLADKLDTLARFYWIDERPSGSRDPFALRRAAISVIALILRNNLRADLRHVIEWQLTSTVFDSLGRFLLKTTADADAATPADATPEVRALNRNEAATKAYPPEVAAQILSLAEKLPVVLSGLLDFFADRLKVQQREAGVRHDLIDAVFALGGEDDLVRLLARVHALQAFVGTEDGANLLAGYKRAANILKKEGVSSSSPLGGEGRGEGERGEAEPALSTADHPHPTSAGSTVPRTVEDRPGDDPTLHSLKGEGLEKYTPEPAEAALIAALAVAEPAAAAAVAREDFESAMAALATLRAPIDAFFEGVIVNDPDQSKRAARLALLEKVRNAVHGVADFSKIEG